MHAYRADRAFDGERVLPGGALVLVDAGRIADVRPAGSPAPPDVPVTALPGTTLLPGLVDTHVHLCGDGGPRALDQLPELTAGEIDRIVAAALQRQLATGVTTVRDLGDHDWAVVDRAPRTGPTVLSAGPPLTAPGGHCWSMGGEARGAEALRAAVRERAERGAAVVKLMASGGAMTPGTDMAACQFTDDEVHAVVDQAHRLGLPVTAHAYPLTATRQVLAAGVDGIEHCLGTAGSGWGIPPDLADGLARAGTAVCPTLGTAVGSTPPPHPGADRADRRHRGGPRRGVRATARGRRDDRQRGRLRDHPGQAARDPRPGGRLPHRRRDAGGRRTGERDVGGRPGVRSG